MSNGKTILIDEKGITIGRSSDNDFEIDVD